MPKTCSPPSSPRSLASTHRHIGQVPWHSTPRTIKCSRCRTAHRPTRQPLNSFYSAINLRTFFCLVLFNGKACKHFYAFYALGGRCDVIALLTQGNAREETRTFLSLSLAIDDVKHFVYKRSLHSNKVSVLLKCLKRSFRSSTGGPAISLLRLQGCTRWQNSMLFFSEFSA